MNLVWLCQTLVLISRSKYLRIELLGLFNVNENLISTFDFV